jgi:hypothetical protein
MTPTFAAASSIFFGNQSALGGPVGKFPAIPPPPTHTTQKIKQQKKTEKWDQPQTDHSKISTKPLTDGLGMHYWFLE